MLPTRNCLEAGILAALGGTDEQCAGTQNEVLADIVTLSGGTPTSSTRNGLLDEILEAVSVGE